MSLAAGMSHVRPHPEVILPMISSQSPKLSRKRKIDWDVLASTSFDDDVEVIVIGASGTSASSSSSSSTLPPLTSSSVSLSVSGTSTASTTTSSADHGTSDTQPVEMGSESSEGDEWLVVHTDYCECNRCIAEHGEIHVRLY